MAGNDPTDTGGLFVGRRPGTAPVRLHARPALGSPARQRFDRVLAAAVLTLEALLCLSLFGPQPLGWFWVGSQVQYETGYVTAGIATILLGCLASLMATMAIAKRLDHVWKLVRRARWKDLSACPSSEGERKSDNDRRNPPDDTPTQPSDEPRRDRRGERGRRGRGRLRRRRLPRLQGRHEARQGVAPLQRPRADQGREHRVLTGRAEVDAQGKRGAGDRDAKGAVIFHYVGDNTICYGFTLRGAATPTMAHIHRGKAGRNGDPVITFANVPKDKAGRPSGQPGASSGCKTLTEPSEIAALRRIKAHPQRYYVNFHTTEFPNGAVRGQLGRVLFDND